MSVSGISSSNFLDLNVQSIQSRMQKVRQEFQQLGQDLQSGNLSAAQADFATLQQLGPQAKSASSTQSANSLAQEFNQLAQDLQGGNLSAAQQDYAQIQQDVQNQTPQAHHHHHHGGGGATSAISQEFNQARPSAPIRQPLLCAAGLQHPPAGIRAVCSRQRTAFRADIVARQWKRHLGERLSRSAGSRSIEPALFGFRPAPTGPVGSSPDDPTQF
jgi:hypothetical protein